MPKEQPEDTSSLNNILSAIDVSPDWFLQPSSFVQTASLVAAKGLLDPVASQYSVFHEVALKGLDVEQVWEQIKLVGEQIRKHIVESKDVEEGSRVTNGVERNSDDDNMEEDEIQEDDEEMDLEEEDLDGDDEESEDEAELDGEEEEEEEDAEFPMNPEFDEEEDETDKSSPMKQFNKDVHGLNDQFFSIDDFNRLSEQQDIQQLSDAEDDNADDIDYFADPDEQDSDVEDENPDEITYDDFYLPPPNANPRKRKRTLEPADDFASDNEPESLLKKDLFADEIPSKDAEDKSISAYEKRKAVFKEQVTRLEQENIQDKEWMYLGEASAKNRPKNSLLEVSEELDVERSTKPVPVVTEERTRSLEEIIKQRIIDNHFDDVKLKLPPSLLATKSRVVEEDPDLQDPSAKSTRGLAEVYEAEHLRRIDPINNPTKLSTQIQKQHDEIDQLWKRLSHQLDNLTSLRFIPDPEVVEEYVVANIPALQMEDERPEVEAGESRLAPQEVYKPVGGKGEVVVGGVLVSKEEMSREDKARARKRTKEKKKGKKEPAAEGSRRDVVDTLKKGGVKIISGQGKRKAELKKLE